ncbi:hypothetical protein B0H11DRAFT_1375397 [Mycena galericulata]|nr:hypothetical protein B0H11DRAFT_1375397 [Mycena galericulata]
MVAQGLAPASVTPPGGMAVSVFEMPSALPDFDNPDSESAKSPSLLELLREAYNSPLFTPIMSYDTDALMVKHLKDWTAEPSRGARRIYSKWTINLVTKSLIEKSHFPCNPWLGQGKTGREPRQNFFLMHNLTPVPSQRFEGSRHSNGQSPASAVGRLHRRDHCHRHAAPARVSISRALVCQQSASVVDRGGGQLERRLDVRWVPESTKDHHKNRYCSR